VAVSGFTTVILLISLIGSFIMFGLGLIGMYIGQIFAEVKKRPLYIVDERKSKLKKTISAE
jgi:dolichol-phosphate mannosyltransferase